MLILGIETSCDETAAAILEAEESEKPPRFNVLSNIVSSQVELHARFGGVVPNLAAREHTKNIIPVLKQTFQEAEINAKDIDLISVTRGPGLIPALLIGTSAAKTLAYAWKKPIIGINHIEGHIYANWIKNPDIEFPVLALIVSGGHTELVLMRDFGKYESIGGTRDDAAGEAFDKAARLLGLGYPGGPAVSKASEEGTPGIYSLPRPMITSTDFDFSFSGIKTAVRELTLLVAKNNGIAASFSENNAPRHFQKIPRNSINNIAAEFQQAIIDVLVYKTYKATAHFNPKTVILAGGVAANKELRRQLDDAITEQKFSNYLISKFPKISNKSAPSAKFLIPDFKYCTDNAAMIAAAGYFNRSKATITPWEVETDANLVIAKK